MTNERDWTEAQERIYAERVMAQYFDTDITTRDAAMDVFLDNGVKVDIAREIADNMFPEEA